MSGSTVAEALRHPEVYPEPTAHVEMCETHASMVFLTEHYAYKIKKPVDFGFLDYSTLERRQFFCTEELRLNQRLAPSIYLEVLALRQTPQGYRFQGAGPVAEYVLKMRRLPAQASLDALLARQAVPVQTLEALARRLADFHTAPVALDPDQDYGTLRQVEADWHDNFTQTVPCVGETIAASEYAQLRQVISTFTSRHADWFAQRVAEGRVRDCHGDLRAEHVYVLDGQIHIIDCIEFSPQLRFIDVASEVAFLAMDLERLGFAGSARDFVRAYVAATNDVTLYRLLDFYRCYRAYVRGKVASLRLRPGLPEAQRLEVRRAAVQAFRLAVRYASRCLQPLCIITTGLIGSGKSTLAAGVAAALAAPLLSSDRLRKEQAGLAPDTRQHVAYGTGLYDAGTTQQTYNALLDLAQQHLREGQSVVLDASFARRAARLRLAQAARQLGAVCCLLECYAPEDVIRQRLEKRSQQATSVSDGRVEILQQFQSAYEPVQPDEPLWHSRLDTTGEKAQVVQAALATLAEAQEAQGDTMSPEARMS